MFIPMGIEPRFLGGPDHSLDSALSQLIYLTLRRSLSLDSVFYMIVTSNKATYGTGLFPCTTISSCQFSCLPAVPYSHVDSRIKNNCQVLIVAETLPSVKLTTTGPYRQHEQILHISVLLTGEAMNVLHKLAQLVQRNVAFTPPTLLTPSVGMV